MQEETEYTFDLERYLPRERFERIKAFSSDKRTPFLVVDLDRVGERYDELKHLMPEAKIHYAIKANPHNEVLRLLLERGSNFDVASIYELNQILALGAPPERLSYGNTIKKARDIAYAYGKGIRLFATDSEADVRKLAQNAPGSKVFFRIITEGTGADWPLSRKFGTHPDTIYRLILLARDLGLVPYGLSFHVGSQQRDIGEWGNSIATCKYLFDAALERDIHLRMINLGGGFPTNYLVPTPPLELYAREIRRFLLEDFHDDMPELLLEPGRYMAGDAGVLVSEVILVSQKTPSDPYRWVYLDVGKFGGLIETLDEAIKYPIYVEKGGPAGPVILAGPTCDSADILYEKFKYRLPLSLEEGDRVYFLSTGAYTASYASVEFNGLPPLPVYILE